MDIDEADEFPANTAALKALFANIEVNRKIGLYLREREGLLIWQAYQECRKLGQPVPETILVKFDQWASRLASARGAKEIAQAIEMSGSNDNGRKGSATGLLEKMRDVAIFVKHLRASDLKPGAAYRHADIQFHLKAGMAKKYYQKWYAPIRERDRRMKDRSPGVELVNAWTDTGK